MEPATNRRQAGALDALLAGLQAGMLGACWMLAWLGITAKLARRSFWTPENLMSTVFYGERAIRSGFSGRTLPGLALYLLIYSSLGVLFALALNDRLSRIRTLLVSLIFALGWYYLSFQFLWRGMMPLVALLHSEQPTVLGHVVYGTFLGRYPVYLKAPAPAAVEAAAQEAAAPAPELPAAGAEGAPPAAET